jgi:D-alanyl-D-alanine endopeptidase (penicillin-binding protein 7)
MGKIKYLFLALLLASPAWSKTKLTAMPAPSVVVYNISQNKIEYARNADIVRPIASVTKIMTAMVALDYDKDLARPLRLSTRVSGHLPMQNYNRWQLLQAMLVKSDNAAAETLAADYPGGRTAFIERMNSQAQDWGLKNTKFEDPTGIGAGNTSNVKDLAIMLETSAAYWVIQEISTRKHIAVETQLKKQVRTINLNNTNAPLLFEFDNILVSKTGLTSRAGWCVGLVVEQRKQRYSVIVLGSQSKQDRFRTVERVMYNHIIDNQLVETELSIRP